MEESQDIGEESESGPKYHSVDCSTIKPKQWPHRLWSWLRAKRIRMVGALVIVALVAGTGAIAATDLRYPVLGLFIKGTVIVQVRDSATKLPVPKASVTFAGANGTTDGNGEVTLGQARIGRGHITVHKAGYADASTDALVPVRHRPTIVISINPNGIKVVAQVKNRISGGPIAGVEVKAGDASSLTDSSGRAELSLPLNAVKAVQTITFSDDGYNPNQLSIPVHATGESVAVELTPSGKVYFQSNRTGRIDIYSSNLDGTSPEVVLAGTGNEDEATGILTSISDPHTLAIVSSREGRREGSLHHDLYIFNTESQKLSKIDSDVEFNNYRTFIGSTLVYTKSKVADNFGCSDIKTYDVNTGKTSALFTGDQIVGCPTITLGLSDSFVYSVRYASSPSKIGIYIAKLGGSSKRISANYSDNTVRRAKQTLLSEYFSYNAGSGSNETWDSIDLGNFVVTRLPNGPSIETSRYYNDSPDGSLSAFVEERDGKSELYLTDGNGGNEKKLTSMGSANQFVQWYGQDYLVFSSTKTDENALYVMSATGGTPIKISDFYRGNQRTYGGGGNPYN